MFNRSYIHGHEGHPHYLTDVKVNLLSKKFLNYKNQEELFIIIKALSDPTKLSIYSLLQRIEEISVSDISQILGVSQSTASHALSDLRKIGIVKSRRCGKCICYSLIIKRKTNKISDFLKILQ